MSRPSRRIKQDRRESRQCPNPPSGGSVDLSGLNTWTSRSVADPILRYPSDARGVKSDLVSESSLRAIATLVRPAATCLPTMVDQGDSRQSNRPECEGRRLGDRGGQDLLIAIDLLETGG
jgi:hypothetical protein